MSAEFGQYSNESCGGTASGSEPLIINPEALALFRKNAVLVESQQPSGDMSSLPTCDVDDDSDLFDADAIRRPKGAKTVLKAIEQLGLEEAVHGAPQETMCVVNPDAFEIVRGKKNKRDTVYTIAAKAVCNNCLSLIRCREDNIDNDDPLIYGGLTHDDRAALRKRIYRPPKK